MTDSTRHNSFLPALLRSLLPATGMGWALCAGLLIWFLNWTLANETTNTLFGSRVLKFFFDVASVLALIPLAWFLWKGTRWFVRTLLWRLRQRLIVTYFLIGVLPLVLLTLLIGLIGAAVFIESSSGLVMRQIEGYIAQSHSAAHALASDLNQGELSRLSNDDLRRELQERVDDLASVFPGLRIAFRRSGKQNVLISIAPESSAMVVAAEGNAPIPALPAWLNDQHEFHGLVIEKKSDHRHQLLVRHIVKLNSAQPGVIEMSYPLGNQLAQQVSTTTGVPVEYRDGVVAFPHNPGVKPEISPDVNVNLTGEEDSRSISVGVNASGIRVVIADEGSYDPNGFPILMPAARWETGETLDVIAVSIDRGFLGSTEILRRFRSFQTSSTWAGAIVAIISLLAAVFLAIAGIAVISAAVLTRSITSAVHQLYQGTKRVEAGDFDHEIPIRGTDQLAALSVSFNQMTSSIRELLRVSAEKQRLDQEMKIAAEVQSRLFPRTVPKNESLDIAPGICIPAREVSGDYYDFLEIAPGVIAIVVADVCGKGMSAALLMSNLQASLRGQAQAYRDAYQSSWNAWKAAATATGETASFREESSLTRHRARHIVERVNQQIESSTSDSRFVTMFYAEFDEASSTLHYVNAGHNPPLLLRNSSASETSDLSESVIESLDKGGTVLGMFSLVEYEEGELILRSGDVLVACTDGIFEACNAGKEEFGEERLAVVLAESAHLSAAEIERHILQSVKDWTGGTDQEDDLTLVVVKKK